MRKRAPRPRSAADGFCLAVCLLFALAHILFFHNKFFDINRSKYYLFVCAMPAAALTALILRLCGRPWRRGLRAPDLPAAGMAILLIAAAASACLARDPRAAWTGSEGRCAGGLFYMALALLYVLGRRAVRAFGPGGRAALAVEGTLVAGGAVCAAVGILNFLGYDPLVFYVETLKPIYHNDFISTIGNINFFSAYMCLMAALAAGLFLRLPGRGRWLCLAAFALCWMGVLAARSESGMVGMAALGVAAAAAPARSQKEAGRLALLPATACLAVWVLRRLLILRRGHYMELYDSIARTLLRAPVAMLAGGVLLLALAAALLRSPERPGILRGVRAAQRAFVIAAFAAAALAAGLIFYYTVLAPQAEPPLAALRMDERWGTFRGFIWRKTAQLWREFPLLQKILGVGPDCLRPLLVEKCYDEMVALTGILFDNAHNEFLQLLVTTGALGLAGYVLLAASSLRAAWRDRTEPAAFAAFVALCAHLAQSVFNIAQPETTPAVFLLFALAAGVSGKEDIHAIREDARPRQ